MQRLLEKAYHKNEIRRLDKKRAALETMALDHVARLERQARQLRRAADALHIAACRRVRGATEPAVPDGTIWASRAGPWAAPVSPASLCPVPTGSTFGTGLSLHHDGKLADLSLVQETAQREGGAPFWTSLDCLDFDGSYLSLALSIPEEICTSLTAGDVIALSMDVLVERPTQAYGRLNLRQGPNTETIVRDLDLSRSQTSVEFDLYYTDLESDQISSAWVDVIFEEPKMNRLLFRDVYLSRRRRADA